MKLNFSEPQMHNDVFLNHISEIFVALNPLSMAEHLVDASCLFIYQLGYYQLSDVVGLL